MAFLPFREQHQLLRFYHDSYDAKVRKGYLEHYNKIYRKEIVKIKS
jgi:hypothetical protein